jgi:hypothetical protein
MDGMDVCRWEHMPSGEWKQKAVGEGADLFAFSLFMGLRESLQLFGEWSRSRE